MADGKIKVKMIGTCGRVYKGKTYNPKDVVALDEPWANFFIDKGWAVPFDAKAEKEAQDAKKGPLKSDDTPKGK